MNAMIMVLQVTISFVLAVDAVACAVALAGPGSSALAPITFLVTGGISFCLAMPAYFVLRLARRETWRSCIIAGFIVGATVAAWLLQPVSGYAEAIGFAGGIGAGAGAAFWATSRLLEYGARSPRLGRLALIAGASLAFAASATLLALPRLVMDRSCHNPFRDQQNLTLPVLSFSVELAEGEWPRLQATAERFASAEGLSIDASDSRDDPFSVARFVSACNESGTDFRVVGADAPERSRAEVSVFQPQGGTSWQRPSERLLAAIEAAFPGRLRRDQTSTEVQTPSTLLPGKR